MIDKTPGRVEITYANPQRTYWTYYVKDLDRNALVLGPKNQRKPFFVQSFSKTLGVMDVRAKNRGRPRQKVRFSAAPVMGRNFLTQGRPGVRSGMSAGNPDQKVYVYAVFSSLIYRMSSKIFWGQFRSADVPP